MSIFDKFGLGNLSNIKEKVAQTRAKLEDIPIESEVQGVKVTVSAGKNIKNIEIPETLLFPDKKAEMTNALVTALNRALNEAEGVAVKEVKAAGGSIMPGFSKIFGNS